MVWTDLLVPISFPYSLHLHVWFDIPASISTEQPITHHHVVMGLCGFWQLHYSIFVILTLGR